jgi:UDP-3-O-[3-hydroxymyristoyl] N-acetylglucosamine deacetylase
VEHLLSALAGGGITDCLVHVDGPELPIGDGSARVWVDALAQAGVAELDGVAARAPRTLAEPLLLSEKGGAFIAAFPSEALRLTVAIAFDHALVGTQVARFEPARGDDYGEEIAPARTFGFWEEVEALRAAGRARGGSEDNAVVVYPDRYSAPLRFANEFARHKLLDLLGDLSLIGSPLAADVIAHRPSHRLNTEFARLLEVRPGVPSGLSDR